MARQISDEKVAEIERLWRELGVGLQVAKAACVTPWVAMQYKPADAQWRSKNKQGRALHARIRDLWFELGNARKVAEAAGVSYEVAHAYRPAEIKLEPAVPRHQPLGYDTWSEETQERWDEFWEHPPCNSRLRKLMGEES